jgi:hypothetical protein
MTLFQDRSPTVPPHCDYCRQPGPSISSMVSSSISTNSPFSARSLGRIRGYSLASRSRSIVEYGVHPIDVERLAPVQIR